MLYVQTNFNVKTVIVPITAETQGNSKRFWIGTCPLTQWFGPSD